MNQNNLHDLLADADASAPPPPTMMLLAEGVRNRARLRVRRQQAGGVCALLLVAGVVSVLAFRPRDPSSSPTAQARLPQGGTRPAPAFDAAAAAAEAASLRAEAARGLTVANEAMKRADRRRRLARAAASLAATTPPTVGDQRDRAALTLLDHGDRLRRELKEVDAALAAYRRTIELFPETKWAAVAKQRIHELRPDAALARPHNELT